jgi:hypothetical protein
MPRQIAPADLARYAEDGAALMSQLAKLRPDVTIAYRNFNPYPWAVSAGELDTLVHLSQCIARACRAFVENYFDNPRLRQFVSVEPKTEAWLRKASARPCAIGAIRPDFLHAADATPVVNEINARFPLNGFYVSALAAQALGEKQNVFQSQRLLKQIPAAIRHRLGNRREVIVVKAAERGYDVRLLMQDLNIAEAQSPETLRPSELQQSFALLELHQHELLGRVPDETMNDWAEHGDCLNDLRTIFLVHDKRLLAAIAAGTLDGYLSHADAETLRRHVIPTFVVGLNPEIVDAARQQRGDWVLKPNLLGKAEGVVIGHDVSPEAWHAALAKAGPTWVLQRYIQQRRFPIVSEIDGQVATRLMHVIGLLPTLDEQSFGPGIYRAGPDAVVNVAGGGTILTPVVANE